MLVVLEGLSIAGKLVDGCMIGGGVMMIGAEGRSLSVGLVGS